MKTKKRLVAAGLSAGLLAGGAAGFAFTSGSPVAIAQTESSPSTSAPADGSTQPNAKPDRKAWMSSALAPLVSDGTISQEQADKVIAALDAAAPPKGERGMFRGGPFGQGLDAAATALGISTDDLKAQLKDGKSIADIAKDKGVEVQKVIDALVAEAKQHLTDAVSNGRMTQAQADEALTRLTDGITKMVNGEMPARGPGFGHRRGHDGDTPDAPDAPDSSSTPTTTPSTSGAN